MTATDALREAQRRERRAGALHIAASHLRLNGGEDTTADTLAAWNTARDLRIAAEERVAAERMGVTGPALVALGGGR